MQKIQNRKASEVEGIIWRYVKKNRKITTFFLWKKRFVFLDKYLSATQGKPDRTSRMRLFFAGIELIKSAKTYKSRDENGLLSYKLRSPISDKAALVVHIREESLLKDKRLFLISTFESRK